MYTCQNATLLETTGHGSLNPDNTEEYDLMTYEANSVAPHERACGF